MIMWRLQHKYAKSRMRKAGTPHSAPALDDRIGKDAMKSGCLVLLDQLADLGNRRIGRLAIGD